MGATTRTLLTFEEFERLPERPGKEELLKGELVELPPAKAEHNEIAKRIFKRLDKAVEEAHARGEGVGVGAAFHEMGYQLAADTWVQPDVSVTHAGQLSHDYYHGAPAIAIEVVSPANTAEQMALKTQLYFQFGALEVWRLYRNTRQAEVHVPGKATILTEGDSITTPLLPGLSLSVREALGD